MDQIAKWGQIRFPTKEAAKNKCNDAVRELVSVFPELTVQVGTVKGVMHCWAVTPKGKIVDPTKHQFDFDITDDDYNLIASRFLNKDEYEPATGAVFLSGPL